MFFVIVCKLDVKGVALATIISQGISSLLIIIYLLKNKGFFHFKLKELHFYYKEAKEIIKIGLPAGIQGTIFSLSNVLIQSSINSLGTNVMDGNGASSSLEGFVYVAMNSVATSCVAFVSANFGAKNIVNIKKVIGYACLIIVLMNLFVGAFIISLQDQLLSLYISHIEALDAAKSRLIIIIVTYFLCGLMDTFAYSIRGLGHSITPTIVSLLGICGIRILWIYTIFNIEKFHNLSCIAISYPISWIITAIIQLIILKTVYKKIKYSK